MTAGVIAVATVAHVPTLARAEITPDFQHTLVEGEHRLGEELRALKPDLWVIASTHWVSTFNWFATCQTVHEGVCVADEAPDLVPGIPYRYRGDPEFAGKLVAEWKRGAIPAERNETPHYSWDYGTFVPLSHLDPKAEVAVVGVPSVLMANLDECLRAGAGRARRCRCPSSVRIRRTSRHATRRRPRRALRRSRAWSRARGHPFRPQLPG